MKPGVSGLLRESLAANRWGKSHGWIECINEVDDFLWDANTTAVKIIEMDEQRLNEELKNLAKQALPELPNTFKAGVWRSIRARSSPDREKWFDELVSILLRPHCAALALAITLGIGATLGQTFADAEAPNNQTSLGLNVFSGDAPALPSTLLSQPR